MAVPVISAAVSSPGVAVHQLSSSIHRHVHRPSSLFLLLVLLTVSSSLPAALCGNQLQNLQAGWSPGVSNVITNGALNQSYLPGTLSSWQTLPGIFFWLSPPVPSAVPPQPLLANISLQPAASHSYVVQPLLPAGQLLLVSADPLQPLLVNFTTALCNVPQDEPSQYSELTIYVVAGSRGYNTINLYFTHDCYYPRINVGSSPSSAPDIIQSAELVGQLPQLAPNRDTAAALLVVTPTQPIRTLFVSVTWEALQWPQNTSVPFYTGMLSASSATIRNLTTVTPGFGVVQSVDTSLPWPAVVDTVAVTVTADCPQSSEQGWVLLTLSFYYQLNVTLNITVDCGRALGETYWPSLQVSSTPSSTYNTSLTLVNNGRTTQQFQQGEGQMVFPVQQRYFTLNMSYYPAPPVYSLLFDAEALSQGTVGNVVGATWGTGSAVTLGGTIPGLPTTGSASFTIETVCIAEGQLTVRVTLGGAEAGQGGMSYGPTFIYLSMLCSLPLFNLSTTPLTTQPNLYSAGRVVQQPAYPYIAGSNTFIIPVQSDIEAVEFWLSLQTVGPTVFVWRLLPGENYANIAFYAGGRSFQGGSLSQWSPPQLITSFPAVSAQQTGLLPINFPSFVFSAMRCLGPDSVSVVTQISFGWQTTLQLQFMRECTVADTDGSDEELDAAAVVAIVFTVMITALCCLGCGYNYSVKHQRGWAVVPGHDCWQRLQDSTLGPKRYTPQMDDLEEGVEIHNTRPVTTSSGYGTYGSAAAADGYGAADGYMGDL